ncbi:MAG: HoxN/HupN/NixA family nickel/cobalt transporter [Gemmataceae bacterium]
MRHALFGVANDGCFGLRAKVVAIYALLVAANLGAWLWAVTEFRHSPLLLGTCLLAYTFGLRHAVDADHIAAIDNVTRKLLQEGKRPAGVGFFFALGHSTIVVIAPALIAVAALAFKHGLPTYRDLGGMISTSVSALFLLTIAAMNIVILIGIWRTFRRVKNGAPYNAQDLDILLAGRGLLARLFRPLFRMIRQSWHMYPLGFLFGLGFDTATEVAVLGISVAQAAQGMPVWSVLIFPVLFAAGMSLVDTTDGILMLGAYGWAFSKPIRKLYYNLTITFVCVFVAVAVGGIEALGLIQDRLTLNGPFWDGVGALNANFGTIGYLIIGIFVVSWIVSAAVYRLRGYDALDVEISRS